MGAFSAALTYNFSCCTIVQVMQDGLQKSKTHLIELHASFSECQKRAVVCVILDASGRVLAIGTNRCAPPSSGCPRLALSQSFGTYNDTLGCSPEHAEIDALERLPANSSPARAEIYGHDFACPSCLQALNDRGITDITAQPFGQGTGVRNALHRQH